MAPSKSITIDGRIYQIGDPIHVHDTRPGKQSITPGVIYDIVLDAQRVVLFVFMPLGNPVRKNVPHVSARKPDDVCFWSTKPE